MLPDTLRLNATAAALEERFPAAIVEGSAALGELTLQIEPASIVEVCRFLKQEQGFERLCSVTAVDWFPMEPRFEVVYHLHSVSLRRRLRLKCRLGGERPQIESVTCVWDGANWYEREVYDLFGIEFTNHPELRRILLPDYWQGHPLRKDFPVHGHKYSYSEE